VSKYELKTALGHGSRSTTWRAVCSTGGCHGQQVVLTSIAPPTHQREQVDLTNLLAIAQLWHPNLAKLLQVGRTGSDVYLVSEYIKGRSLQEMLQVYSECGQRMPQGLVLWALGISCEALAYLHEQGLFHGGVSARRVMLAESGWVKLRGAGIGRTGAELRIADELTEVGQRRDREAVAGILDQLVLGTEGQSPPVVRGLFDRRGAQPLRAIGQVLMEAARITSPAVVPPPSSHRADEIDPLGLPEPRPLPGSVQAWQTLSRSLVP